MRTVPDDPSRQPAAPYNKGAAEDSPFSPAPAARWFWPTLAGLMALAAFLAIWHLGDKSLWSDEVQTAHIGSSWTALRERLVGRETNMWFFYALLAAWQRVTHPTSEAALRLLPALLGVAALPALALWGRRLGGPRVGVIAAALLALNGSWLQHAQTLRGYSLVVALAAAVPWLLMRLLESPRPGRVVALAVAAALGLYTHLYFVLLFGALGLSVLSLPAARVPWRALFATGALVVVLMLPMLLLQPFGRQLDWVLPLSLRDAARIPLYFGGYSIWVTPLFLLGWCGATALAVQRWRTFGRSEVGWRWVLPLCAFLAPVLLLTAGSLLVRPVLVPRYLSVSLPAALVVMALALDRLHGPALRRAALVVLLALSLPGLAQWYRRPPVEDWRGLLAWVAPEGRPDDAAVFLPYFHIYSYRFYAARSANPAALPAALESSSGPYEGGGWGPIPDLRPDLMADLQGRSRVWLLTTGHAEPRRMPWDKIGQVRAALAASFVMREERDFGRLKIQRWERADTQSSL